MWFIKMRGLSSRVTWRRTLGTRHDSWSMFRQMNSSFAVGPRAKATHAFPSSVPLLLPRRDVFHRFLSSVQTEETKKNDSLRETQITSSSLPAFEGAGLDVARKFVQDGSILDDVKWKREERLDAIPQELLQLYNELEAVMKSGEDTDRVQHLGEGVYVQRNEHGIDEDGQDMNPCTVTRIESRSVVHHALDALQLRRKVCVTGQPGIGKTRGCMMYAIQTLLAQGSAVLYVGYKSDKMLLFLPGEDGSYRVWSAIASKFMDTQLKQDNRLVSIIDPPEKGDYSVRADGRVLLFASNNAKKHFENWEKDGILLVTFMPSAKEVIVMTPVLWNDITTPHSWQVDELNTLEEKKAEIAKRIELIGAIPRLVFDSDLLNASIKDCVNEAARVADDVSDINLFYALLGKYSPNVGKHASSASSKVLLLNPNAVDFTTMIDRKRNPVKFQLNPVAALVLRNRLLAGVVDLVTANFEDFAFRWLYATRGRKPEVQSRRSTLSDGIRRIIELESREMVVFRPGYRNFPMLDFALSATSWYNAKSVESSKQSKYVYIDLDGATQFLEEMERSMGKCYTRDAVDELLLRDAPTLTVLTNGNVEARFEKRARLHFFGVSVQLRTIRLTEDSAYEALDVLHDFKRTKTLLEDIDVSV